MKNNNYIPRLIAWEVTRRCKLKCRHCRAAAEDRAYAGEFTTDEIKKTLSNIASFARPIIILTGGEPMCREDIYEIAAFGDSLGLHMVMAPCGQMVTRDALQKMKEAGIKRISLSIDGATAETHDSFRGVEGSHKSVIEAAKLAKEMGMPFQINTTVTKLNLKELPEILALTVELGAVSFHPFLLVPTGRGEALKGMELKPSEYEDVLKWISERSKTSKIHVKPTCAPHYFRVHGEEVMRHPHGGLDAVTRGCLGGTGFAFISHTGTLQICGFLDIPCGDLRQEDYDFKKIWGTSDVFGKMRDQSAYKGKCGICEYHSRCGGCRARAYAMTGNYMMPEPFCVYQPVRRCGDDDIMSGLQDDFPIEERPFRTLAAGFQIIEEELIDKIRKWIVAGKIRHLSGRINMKKLGFNSALVAMRVDGSMIGRASEIIGGHPGVSHNYLRDHKYNIWFTVRVPKGLDLDAHVQRISALLGVDDYMILPSKKMFKLDVRFDVAGLKNSGRKGSPESDPVSVTKSDLTDAEYRVIEALNMGIEVTQDPYKRLAENLGGMTAGDLIAVIDGLKKRGIIRGLRFVLNHYTLGISDNAMVVWNVPAEKVDEIGKMFAKKPFVSHCYERTFGADFNYNLYTMIHAASPSAIHGFIRELSLESGINDFAALTTREELFKRKATILPGPYKEWEKNEL